MSHSISSVSSSRRFSFAKAGSNIDGKLEVASSSFLAVGSTSTALIYAYVESLPGAIPVELAEAAGTPYFVENGVVKRRTLHTFRETPLPCYDSDLEGEPALSSSRIKQEKQISCKREKCSRFSFVKEVLQQHIDKNNTDDNKSTANNQNANVNKQESKQDHNKKDSSREVEEVDVLCRDDATEVPDVSGVRNTETRKTVWLNKKHWTCVNRDPVQGIQTWFPQRLRLTW